METGDAALSNASYPSVWPTKVESGAAKVFCARIHCYFDSAYVNHIATWVLWHVNDIQLARTPVPTLGIFAADMGRNEKCTMSEAVCDIVLLLYTLLATKGQHYYRSL